MSDTSDVLKKTMDNNGRPLTPKEIVAELDRFIVGQNNAKRAVAIALRNRWRRMQVSEELRPEVTPKNILMIGPTGVGKTEIARRLAKLVQAPFIKVEATKFTEIGYVGRDVDSIIRDLVDIAVKMKREEAMAKVKKNAEDVAEKKILDKLIPLPAMGTTQFASSKEPLTRQQLLEKLRLGELDSQEIEIELSMLSANLEIMGPPGMEEMTQQLNSLFQNLSSEKKKKRKLLIKDAFRLLKEEEASKLIDDDELRGRALDSVEQNGIVFIDEIDKIARRTDKIIGADVSREGVQRDLLPLIEGCTVSTKYGTVKTDHILFITSGAFLMSKPSDLIPELQGRLPIRVELKALSTDDFVRILTEPKASLTRQYTELLKTENVTLQFKKDAIKRIAEIAFAVNEKQENIGARRLHTVMERLLEKISFEASEMSGKKITITKEYVAKHLDNFVKDIDLSRYIL